MSGYYGTLVRVNLTTGKISTETIDRAVAGKFIGGRGLGTYYLKKEIDPKVDPLSPDNKLIFATGPLTGSTMPAASRYMAITKSPLTGTVASSNAGGYWGPELRFAGVDLLILEGKAPKPAYLLIHDGKVTIHDASAYWGKLVGETTDGLLAECREPKARVLCIGPAGEHLSPIAAILNDKYRAAGRSGVGAVMGSKNLKAVVVRGTGKVAAAQPDKAEALRKDLLALIKANGVTGQGLPTYGTAVLVNIINESGIYPTRNFQTGVFETANQASGEALKEKYLTGKDVCFRCPIACGRYCKADDVEGGGPEYETLWAFSADCGVSDLGVVIKANKWCNEYGLDTISAGATIACAMEMVQRGILKPGEVDGPPLQFGSGAAIVEWTRKMGAGEGLGAKMALGSYRFAELYGVPELSMSVKKQELPAYDPRGLQGHGLQYATSNRGGCHVRGYMISAEVLGIPEKLDPHSIEGKAKWAKLFQDLTAVIDSLGLCLFTSFAVKPDHYRDMYNVVTGRSVTTDELLAAGERIWNMERLFNLAAGISPDQDTLPKRLLKEPLLEGGAKGKVHRLSELLPEYYRERGWTPAGVPTEEKLAQLAVK
ncbi:MAG: aldehyde ferredoxin oxidoreductase family protein [Planctomycetota bacterium]|nr:aldehyde ferredoxin oxidoreductase family protein [Planctomycetota bacterium]